MSQEQNKYQYSAEDIIRYIEGRMTPAEMHALEKAALEDPMLADAIEGMQGAVAEFGVPSTLAPIPGMQKAFAHRHLSKTPVRSMRWWQTAAAAVILLIGAAMVYYTVQKKSSPDLLSVNEREKSKNETVHSTDSFKQKAAATADKKNTPSASLPPPDTNTFHSITTKKSANKKQPPLATETAQTASPQTSVATPQASNRTANAEIQKDTFQSQAPDVLSKAEYPANVKRKGIPEPPTVLHVISGRILNPQFQPLAYASLIPVKTNKVLNTDQNGFFNITTTDTMLTVKVSMTGYRMQQFRLGTNQEFNQLVLKPAALQEVVVTGNATRKKAQVEDKKPTIGDAEPVAGWNTFNEYIEQNKIYPAEDSKISGTVTLSFLVSRQGKLSDFNIEQSLAKGYDQEAIRLIKEGPKWKVLKGKKQKVTLSIQF